MKSLAKIALIAALAAPLVRALPAAAAQANVNGILLEDRNQNGRIERAVILIDNPLLRAWRVNDPSSVKVAYAGRLLNVKHLFASTTSRDEIAKIEAVWDESEVPVDTSASQFEVSYDLAPVGGGIDDGTDPLQAISAGDSGAADTEVDRAAPVLVSSDPLAGSTGVGRDDAIKLAFSEPVVASTLNYASDPDAAGWGVSWSSDSKTATLTHSKYPAGSEITFTVSNLKDPSGNVIVPGGAYPNPLRFTNTSGDITNIGRGPVFGFVTPYAGSSLLAGYPAVVSWYSNIPEVVSVRLMVMQAGGPDRVIGAYPVGQGSASWFPPNEPGLYALKAEGLTSQGSLFAFDSRTSITVATPSDKLKVAALIAPAASSVTDSSAVVSVGLNADVQAAELYCNGPKRGEQVARSGDRPYLYTVSLAGLSRNAAYNCQFRFVDAFGAVLTADVPQFTASSGGDSKPPVLIGSPSFHDFNAKDRTAKVTLTFDEPVSVEFQYGLTPTLTDVISEPSRKTTHVLSIPKAATGAKYKSRIVMTDAAGNRAETKDYEYIVLRDGERIKGSGPAVYWFLGGKRYVFPNETVYRSWFPDFVNVLPIPDEQLSGIAIGGNVRLHSGTWMVKIQSDPKTYAVEPGGVLRWIQSEERARALFGPAWNTRVRDIDVSLFTDFTIGEPLKDGEFPDGYAARTADGRAWYVDRDIRRYELSRDGLEANRYAAAVHDAAFFPPAAEGSVAWGRLLVGDAIGAYDERINVIRLSPGGAKVHAPAF